MSDVWTRWQGHVINGVFPLGRYLGCSDHSGVFLTRSPAPRHSEVAIKLVPANRTLTEYHLPRWKRAAALAQPHLLRLLEWGGCQLDGLPHLYLVMEYADQTLAQLLLSRAMTDDEAREMLPPILNALAFLHGRGLVQGQLKPANILVVGDQLKLASDTVRGITDSVTRTNRLTAYDPPEALHSRGSSAADVWALGISLLEALTRCPPSGFREEGNAVVLPADFSGAFRDVVTRCLSPRAQDRPSVRELADWAGGQSTTPVPTGTDEPLTLEPMAIDRMMLEPMTPAPRTTETALPDPVTPRIASPEAAPVAPRATPPVADTPKPRASLAMIVGAIAILALGWTGVHVFSTHRNPTATPTRDVASSTMGAIPSAAAPAASGVRSPISGRISREAGGAAVPASASALREVVPQVPLSARRTIRGHIKVWVRVIVARDGSVFAAIADHAGPSRYFLRLAIEAAKKWTFPAADTPTRRLMQVRFDFSRDGTTARAVSLH